MTNNSTKSSIAKQAGILAIASIIVRIIGLLYRIPLSNIIGDLGNSYYGIAFNIYSTLILLSAYSIPIAVSKLSSGYLALKQYRNAHKVFKISLIFMIVLGAILAFLLYVFAEKILPVGSEKAIYALRAMAPTLFISGIIGVFQGYFQSRKNMLPIATAQILEQLANAIMSIFLAYMLTRAVIGDKVEVASLGSLGGTLGTLVGVIVSVTVLALIYKLNIPNFKHEALIDSSKSNERGILLFKRVTFMIVPIMMSTIIFNIIGIADQYIYYGILGHKGIDAINVGANYGIYIGKYIPLVNLPSALAASVSIATLPNISAAYSSGKMREVRHFLSEGISLSSIITIPSAIGIFVLAKPIIDLLFPNTPDVGYIALKIGAALIIFTGYASIYSGALQGIGKPIISVMAGIISAIVNIAIIVPLLIFTNLGIYSIILATIPHMLIMAFICYKYMNRYTGYRQRFFKPIILPLIAGTLMGICTYVIYSLTMLIININALGIILSIPISAFVYLILIIKLNIVRKNQLATFPGGRHAIRLINKLNI